MEISWCCFVTLAEVEGFCADTVPIAVGFGCCHFLLTFIGVFPYNNFIFRQIIFPSYRNHYLFEVAIDFSIVCERWTVSK